MKRSNIGRFQHLSLLWVASTAALALATWICFRLDLSSVTTSCIYLIIIMLLSLMDSLVSSLLFSVIAVGCLDYFFTEPLFSFGVAKVQDLATLGAFLITSIVIATLVRRFQRLGQAHLEQARLLDLTRDAVLVRDLDNVITYWNRGAEALYGWSRAEALNKVSQELLQTIFPIPLERISESLFSSGFWEGELVRARRDGTQVTIASRWSLQRSGDGQPIGILESSNDITERRQAEDALQRIQATYLKEAQHLSHTGSFGWNLSSREIFLSEEGFRIFGFDSKARLSVELVLARIHPDDRALVRRVIDRAATDQRNVDLEHRLLMQDGSVRHIRTVARAMQGEKNSVDFVGAVMDVTAIRLAQLEAQNTRTELEHVMRVTSLGELTASIAHEVNQPLGAIVANAEACLGWLSRESPDLNEVHAAIKGIVSDGLRAGKVIHGIRALIKKTDTLMVPLDLNDIIRETVNIAQNELLSHRVSARLELASGLPEVLGDRIQLQRVLLNLILNAIESMQPISGRPRELVIRSQQDGARQVLISATDCGLGLSAESVHRIFNAFVTTKSSGVGMGLSICRSIVRAHGGRIWASPNEPHGATVQFTLPVHRLEASESVVASAGLG